MKKVSKLRNPVVVALIKTPRHGGAHRNERQQTRQQTRALLRRQFKGEDVFRNRLA